MKLNLETRKKLIEFFESSDHETILLGISIFRNLPEYESIKTEYVYLFGGRYINLETTLEYIKSKIDKNNLYASVLIICALVYWLKTERILGSYNE